MVHRWPVLRPASPSVFTRPRRPAPDIVPFLGRQARIHPGPSAAGPSCPRLVFAGVAARVRFERDRFIEKIVHGWPTRLVTERARAMGFRADERFEDVIEAFIEDDLGGAFVR